MTVTYTIRLPFDNLVISADLADASAPVRVRYDDGEWHSLPFQSADFGHREREMAIEVLDYLGQEYWSDPSIITTSDDGEQLFGGKTRIDYINSLILDITAE